MEKREVRTQSEQAMRAQAVSSAIRKTHRSVHPDASIYCESRTRVDPAASQRTAYTGKQGLGGSANGKGSVKEEEEDIRKRKA